MILTINCGSSSLKYQLYTTDLSEVVAKGLIARIGEDGSYSDHKAGGRGEKVELPVPDHKTALELMLASLMHADYGVIDCPAAITAIGHRAVHGGDVFVDSVVVDDEVMAQLRACVGFAPLHNPCNIAGIEAAMRLFPGVPNIVVFDTAFHQTVPPEAHVYALPYELYAKSGIRKYGFHGTSCRYVSQATADLLNWPIEDMKMVICHLGNGVTLTAVDGGRSVDTSIGFGTFGGVPMGTRSGDFDPSIIFHLVNQLGMSLKDVETLCYHKSGLLGVSGVSNDMREVTKRAADGDDRCRLAVEIFVYQIKKTIGAYAAAMNGLDALVFTAGIGENSAEIRTRICSGLGVLGVRIDEATNEVARDGYPNISAADASVATLVVPTDEERMIAMDTLRLTPDHLLTTPRGVSARGYEQARPL
ncbi:acetate/propionate family kinase [Rhodovulum visakhapatnamense]|uniref:Acetate kinase n=1 Tax=Rhodovulum visakhapatnamense TaxID=364297 RepID=A0ABS1REH9_9RHOB|nr:acetate kinase [Rhodovulum visakhapatnamense]MBL3568022.1 acetate kinase [Rhodovulum visakhapatnamense]MBL3577955.1 acetate kinase [Rhodovulum visakhapatnamense]